jgi:Cd2+/Zn2+-exporting ATPase
LKLELPLLLPAVPDARDRCVRTLIGMLNARDGLAEAHVVAADGAAPAQLCIHYDPDRLSLARVRDLALAAGAQITERFGHLSALLTPPLHARAARTLAARLHQRVGVLEAEVSPSGSLRIEFDRSQADLDALAAELRAHGLDIAADGLRGRPVALKDQAQPQEADKAHDHAHGGLFGEHTELAFSLITGGFLLCGWLLARGDR